MNKAQQKRFDSLYPKHLSALKRHGKAESTHTLRHCYGTLLTDMGVSLGAIQQQMGHECPKTTALYTQLSTHAHNDTDRRINGLLAKLRVVWGGRSMKLQAVVQHYRPRFIEQFGHTLSRDQWSALNAIEGCRQGPTARWHGPASVALTAPTHHARAGIAPATSAKTRARKPGCNGRSKNAYR